MALVRPNLPAVQVTLLASLAFFVNGLDLLAYGVVQQPVIAELGLSLTQSGLLVSVFFITYSAMQVPAGYIADKWGGERTIAVFVTITAVAAIGLSFVNSFALALLCRVLIGFGNGALLPASVRALTSRLRGHQLEVANGFFAAGWGVAQIVVLNLLPSLMAASGWRTPLLAAGVITIGVSVYAWITALAIRPIRAELGPRPAIKLRETITARTVMLVLINVAGIVITIAAVTWAPIQFEKLFKISTVDAARIVSIFGVLTIISSILGGVAARFIGANRVMFVSMLGSFAGVVLLAYPSSLFVGLLLMVFLGFALTFYISPNFSMVPESAPAGAKNPGFVFGVYNTISNALAFFPPLITAYILDTTGSFTLLYFPVAAFALAGLICTVLLGLRRK